MLSRKLYLISVPERYTAKEIYTALLENLEGAACVPIEVYELKKGV